MDLLVQHPQLMLTSNIGLIAIIIGGICHLIRLLAFFGIRFGIPFGLLAFLGIGSGIDMGGEYQIWTSQPTTPIRAEMKKKPEQFVIFLAFVFCRTFRWKMLKSEIWTGVLAAVVAVAVAFVVVMLKRFMEQRICLNKWTKRQRQASLDGTNSGKS